MKNFTKFLGIIALVAVIGLGMTACNKKAGAQEGGTSGGGRTATVTVAPESDFTVQLTRDSGGVIITKYNGTAEVVSIPATIQGLPVREIGRAAFEENRTITSVIIPEGVTGIGSSVFLRCRNLTSVTLPSTLTRSSDVISGLFAGTGLTSFPNPWPAGITTLIVGDFSATKIVDLVIPEGITTINSSAFANCVDLVSVMLPSTIKTINSEAFHGCKNINLASQAAIRAIQPHAIF